MTPLPNIKNKWREWADVTLFECECNDNHYLEVIYDTDEPDGDMTWDGLSFNFIDYPKGLWQVFKWWWDHRKVWGSDLILKPSDIEALIPKLQRYLELVKEWEAKKKLKSKI